MELSKGEKIFLKNVIENLKESGRFSTRYEEMYEFNDENSNLICNSCSK